jgi:striatin 1/3/4
MERSDDVLISGQTSTSIYNNNNTGSINNIQNGDINAVLNNTNSQSTSISNGTNNSNDKQSNGLCNNNVYTMPGILHYLQHEWNRFEFERQQWEVDRAELMTKISFLQGERRGQENLKTNLIRRIKMLELALKQERIKYHKLKYGIEPQSLSINDLKNVTAPTSATNNTNNDLINDIENNTFSISHHPILNKDSTKSTTKQGRELLKQYLQEIGYTDTIVDIRSSRLRALLGLKTSNNNPTNLTNDQLDILNLINNNNSSQFDSITNLVNGNKQLLQLSNNTKKIDTTINQNQSSHTNGNLNNSEVQKILKMSESEAQSMLMMSNLDFSNSNNINNNNNNNSSNIDSSKTKPNKSDFNMDDEDLDEESKSKSDNDHVTDLDTEDALKEFSFLSNESADDGTTSTMWANVDKAQINKMTEQYKKDRKTAKQQQQALASHQVTQRPNRATLQAMIANLSDSDNVSNDSTILTGSSSSSITSNKLNNFSFSNNTKLFLDEEGSFSNDTNLGELSRISVNNTINVCGINDETVTETITHRKTITSKFALRGHFDAVRCIAFHPTDSVLITGSEDQTIKLWNLDKSSLSNKK